MKLLKFILVAAVIFAPFTNTNAQSWLTDGLVAYFPFNGNANDESKNGNNGEVHNATLTSDRFGNPSSAFYFNGSSSYISIPSSQSLMLTENMTFSFWMKRMSVGGMLLCKGDGEGAYSIGLANDGRMGFNRQNITTMALSSTVSPENAWVHVVITMMSGKSCIYFDGKLNIVGKAVTLGTGTGELTLGKINSGWPSYYGGSLDDMRIYNRALSSDEVVQLYNAESHSSNPVPITSVPAPLATNSDSLAPVETNIPPAIFDVRLGETFQEVTNRLGVMECVTNDGTQLPDSVTYRIIKGDFLYAVTFWHGKSVDEIYGTTNNFSSDEIETFFEKNNLSGKLINVDQEHQNTMFPELKQDGKTMWLWNPIASGNDAPTILMGFSDNHLVSIGTQDYLFSMANFSSIPSAVLSAANKLSPPTNEVARLSNVTGIVCLIDDKGVLIETTNFDYLPRIQIADLQDGDCPAVLENKVFYSALTSFGNFRSRTARSALFENQMLQLWLHGKNLWEKIQTRFTVLDEMRHYNKAVVACDSNVRFVEQAKANATRINSSIDANTFAAADAYARAADAADLQAYGFSDARRARFSANSEQQQAENNVSHLQNSAATIEKQINTANQQISAGLDSANIYASRLASYGIVVSSSPPFIQIPPLSMRLEVDAERAASSMY